MAGPQGDQAREGNRSSGSKSGPSGGHRDRTTSAGREAGAAGPTARDRVAGDAGRQMDSGSQRHANRAREIERIAKASGRSAVPDNSGTSPAGRVSSTQMGMARDLRDIGNTDLENFGNKVASMLGFNEQRPTVARAMARVDRTAPGTTIDKRAGWGFDPAGLIGNALGAPFGVGMITGPIADQVSSYFDRPLEIGLGPDVWSGQISPPTFDANTNQLQADIAALGLGAPPKPYGGPGSGASPLSGSTAGGVPPAGGPSGPTPGQAQINPTGGAQNPGLAVNPAQQNPALSPLPAPQTIAPVPKPPQTVTPYGWGQVSLPQNYFMSQMT